MFFLGKGGFKMARRPSLNHQMHLRMQAMRCFGQSKHQAKKEYRKYCEENGIEWNPAKTFGIHSYVTYGNYKQVSKQFIAYMREHHRSIKDINDITKEHAKEYLRFRDSQGLSPYTVSKDMAALNKLFNFDMTKKDMGLRERSYKEITRSRTPKRHDRKYNPENYREQITFAKASGARRESVLRVTPADFRFNESGEVKSVFLREKGGREREATILREYRDEIEKIIKGKPVGRPLFDKYTTKIDNHAFRAEYARKRYKELVEGKGKDNRDYRGYDRECIKQVSKDLGHNRLAVVVEHYMR